MNQNLLAADATGGLLLALTGTDPALAHKQGGILQMPDFASPASMSMHEESTITAGIPLMGVFNNLVVFDQHVAQNSLASVVPELASDWSWDVPQNALTQMEGQRCPRLVISSRLRYQDLRGLTRNFSAVFPASASQVHLTSAAVNGLPSCQAISAGMLFVRQGPERS